MFDNLTFKTMENSIHALWMKQNIIAHNISNYETPGYKAKSISFKDTLEEERKIKNNNKYKFEATVVTDETTNIRPDGNNVDLDKENVELVDTYYQTSALYNKINGQFTSLKYVINNSFK